MEYGLGAYLNPVIRLEMGARSDDWPAEDFEIKPYAAEVFPNMFTVATSCRVHALDAKRTFWEKATLLHAEYHRPDDKPSRERLSRHYYDLYRLSQQAIGRQALTRLDLHERVIKHKSFFFARSWAQYDQAKAGSFHLVPPGARMQELRSDYAQMKPMIFGDYPQWDEIIRGLQQLEERINGG
jgi:hypothetical protein